MCKCGDTYCRWCGPLQGNTYCHYCKTWAFDGGCPNEERCEEQGRLDDIADAEEQRWEIEREALYD